MAITNFIPEIWNAQMQLDFTEAAVAVGLTNRQYEGDLRSGNKVKITTAVPVTVKNYKNGSGVRTTSPDAVSSTQVELPVDQEKVFDFLVDDVDRRQAAGSLEAFTQSAGQGLAEDADKFILSTAATQAGSTTVPTTAVTDPSAVFNVIRDLRKTLNKNHVPQNDRVLVVNAEFEGMLLEAGAKLTDASVSGSTAGLRNATLGSLLGFTLVTTENTPETDVAQAIGFYRPSLAYVSQIQETEAMRDVSSFSDRLRGLHVYGGMVVRPSAVAVWTNAAAA